MPDHPRSVQQGFQLAGEVAPGAAAVDVHLHQPGGQPPHGAHQHVLALGPAQSAQAAHAQGRARRPGHARQRREPGHPQGRAGDLLARQPGAQQVAPGVARVGQQPVGPAEGANQGPRAPGHKPGQDLQGIDPAHMGHALQQAAGADLRPRGRLGAQRPVPAHIMTLVAVEPGVVDRHDHRQPRVLAGRDDRPGEADKVVDVDHRGAAPGQEGRQGRTQLRVMVARLEGRLEGRGKGREGHALDRRRARPGRLARAQGQRMDALRGEPQTHERPGQGQDVQLHPPGAGGGALVQHQGDALGGHGRSSWRRRERLRPP